MFVLNQYVILILAFSVSGELKTQKKRDTLFPFGCQKFRFDILVFPTANKFNNHILKIQWYESPHKTGDWIGIFKLDPKTGKVNLEPVQVIPVVNINGTFQTTITEKYTEATDLGFKGKCLDYYAGYFDKCHTCLAVTCLRIEPDWMWRLRNKIGRKKIRELVIPGTHESAWTASYFKNSAMKTRNQRYTTQNEGILGQLIYGARYLHVAVTHNSDDFTKWWVSFPVSKITPLEKVLQDIRFFLERTKEIVILDLKEFKGFHKNIDHVLFINFLESKVGDIAAGSTFNYDSTLDRIWKSGKRLIIAYDFEGGVDYSTILWKTVQPKRFNERSVTELLSYFEDIYKKSTPKTAWAAMMDLTPNLKREEFLKLFDSYKLADELNTHVTRWYTKKNWLEKSNVVCVNFLKSTGIVRSAIEWNSGECR